MSDDEHLGKTFKYIPRKYYLYAFALFFMVYGAAVTMYYILYIWTSQAQMKISEDCGKNCDEVLTCSATRRSSFHLRNSIMSLGSLFFGIKGINAIANKYAGETFAFGIWLVFVAALYALIVFLDSAYMYFCRDHYTWNMVLEAVMWPIKGVPMNCGAKFELMGMKEYPKYYVDTLVGMNLRSWYYVVETLKIAILCHAAWTTFDVASRFHYGVTGLGANFSIEGWRKQLLLKEEWREMSRNTVNMAWLTAMDAGWTREDLDQMSRPLNGGMGNAGMARQSYSGKMPDPRAYDGFKDDRANVLL